MEGPNVDQKQKQSAGICLACIVLYVFIVLILLLCMAAPLMIHGRKKPVNPTPPPPPPPAQISTHDAAINYTRRGWRVIPVPYKAKEANLKGWGQLDIEEEDVERYFPPGEPSNIAIRTGEPSGGIVDVDIDHPAAVALADMFLPPTDAIYGRPGKPRSHRFYRVSIVPTNKKYEAVGPVDNPRPCMVEIRSTGLLSNCPPSVHPSGEQIAWENPDGEPSAVAMVDLAAAVDALWIAACENDGKPPRHPHQETYGPRPKAVAPIPGSDDVDMAEREKRAFAYIAKMPNAISGAGGHASTFAAACECFRFGLDDAAVERVMNWFNQTKTGGDEWSAKDLAHKITSARNRTGSQFGNRLVKEDWRTGPRTPRHGTRTPGTPSTPAPPGGDVPPGNTDAPAGEVPDEHGGPVRLGELDPKSGRVVLSRSKTLPTADAFLRTFHGHPIRATLVDFAGQLMAWRDNHWTRIEKGAIRSIVFPWLHSALTYNKDFELLPFSANPDAVTDALDSIRDQVYLKPETALPSWLPGFHENAPDPRQLLAFPSGNLNLQTGEVMPPTPAFFNIAAISFEYDPDAPTPENWRAFLSELWGDDWESIQLLQEWMGYCLVADYSFHKALLIVGPPRAGKGVIGGILKKLVGETNVTGPTTESLCGEFGLQQLLGKTVAIVSDARFKGPNIGILAERLLCITGNDPLSINRKNKDFTDTKIAARFVFLTNEVPSMSDASSALTKRFLILQLTRTFYGQEDTALSARLESELPGILLWAIEGLHRLRARGKFVQPSSAADTVQDLQDLGSPVGAFMRDMCEMIPGEKTYLDQLFEAWGKWCEKEKRSYSTTRTSFGRDLASFSTAFTKHRDTHQRVFYQGIALKPQPSGLY